VNLLSRSYGVYNINELGLQKCSTSSLRSNENSDDGEKTYRCGSHEMRIFGAIGSGASSIVQRAMHIPTHRVLALKKINIFEKVVFYLILNFLFDFHLNLMLHRLDVNCIGPDILHSVSNISKDSFFRFTELASWYSHRVVIRF
jgi:hypothetical protein